MLVAILMSVMIGMTAIAVDLSRLYVLREQLRSAADASALAASVELSHQRLDSVVDVATRYARLNAGGGNTADILGRDVEVGIWSFDGRTFSPVGRQNWASSPINAVRITAHQSASMAFGKVFGAAERDVATVAIASVGYVRSTDCVRPWALAYDDLARALAGGGGARANQLGVQDINAIALADATPALRQRFAIGDVEPIDIGGSYAANIRNCSGRDIEPGDVFTAYASTPAVERDTRVALWDFCDRHGGVSGGRGSTSFTCFGSPKVKVVLWGSRQVHGRGRNRTVTYRVKYVGVLRIQGYGGAPRRVRGNFSTMAEPGVFTPEPAPLTRVALVR